MNLDEFIINFTNIKNRINRACELVSRDPNTVKLLPVTKTHSKWAIEYALKVGLGAVGENRVQEVREKKPLIRQACFWELIGHLQSNKVNEAVRCFDRIQSVDSFKLIRKLNHACSIINKELPIFLQCNSGEDPNKYGFSVLEMPSALEAVLEASHLKCEGLMTIAPFDNSLERAKESFNSLFIIRESLVQDFKCPLPELSMGMTQDLEIAIASGSTMIRVGTALFGERP